MPKLSNSARNVLNVKQVQNTKESGLLADGGNLYLKTTPQGTKSWIFRYKLHKPRVMGLGSYPDVSLAEARQRASEARKLLRDRIDPLDQKRSTHAQKTFGEVSELFQEANRSGWTKKHASQTKNTLRTYCVALKDIPIGHVSTENVLDVLKPIWEEKNETANRVRGRIEAVIDYATAMNLRTGDNPARWKGHLSHLLPKRSAVAPVQHLEALPYADIPEFMSALRKREGISPRCLEFTILTAMRVGAVVGAQWDEIQDDVWVIPAARMKGMSSDFKVPLSDTAQQLLKDIPRANCEYIFHSHKGHITIASPLALLKRRMGYKTLTVHGFRSTFRDWAAEQTNFPHHVQEMALAHTIDSKVERSYRRGDLFNKRKLLMQEWSNYTHLKPKGVVSLERMESNG